MDSKVEESHTGRRQSHQIPERLHWQIPIFGLVKCNTDGVYNPLQNQNTAGWVIREANGAYKGSAQAKGRVRACLLQVS